ncbi:MAG: glycosyltransferase family 77 protein [Anaerolineales bacterium]|nr:glycosyltransferase family 77 protein [Anaerolineales bacterium]
MIERGVIYMCWGDPATREAEASMKSLWKHAADLPVMVVGDKTAVKHFTQLGADAIMDVAFVTFLKNENPDSNITEHFVGRPRVLTHLCNVDPFTSQTAFGFKAGKIKPLLAEISPFEKTLYVDAETEFKISPAIGFDLLDKWDLVIAEAETRSLGTTFPSNHCEADKTAAWLKTPHILYHNSGMIFWRKNEATSRLFDLWSEEWLKYKGWDEQVALLRALLRSDVLFLNVPFTWNCRGPQGAFMLYHRFASQAARKFKGHASTPRHTGPSNIPARPLVQVELAPGRFVRCHAGDEAKVKEYYKRMSPMARKVKAV